MKRAYQIAMSALLLASPAYAGKVTLIDRALTAKPLRAVKLTLLKNYHPNNALLNLRNSAMETIQAVSNGAIKSTAKVAEEASNSSLVVNIESSRYAKEDEIKTFVTITFNKSEDLQGNIFRTINSDLLKYETVLADSHYEGKTSFTVKVKKLDKPTLEKLANIIKKTHQMILAEKGTIEPTFVGSRKKVLVQASK